SLVRSPHLGGGKRFRDEVSPFSPWTLSIARFRTGGGSFSYEPSPNTPFVNRRTPSSSFPCLNASLEAIDVAIAVVRRASPSGVVFSNGIIGGSPSVRLRMTSG